VLGEMMVLVVITPEGDEGERLTPVVGVAFLGRNEAVELPFPDDPYLSPSHVRLSVTQEAVFIEDQQTLNGTFMRLQQAVSIGPGDTFVVGRQLLRLEAVGQPASGESTSADGTRLLGSPPPSGGFVLVQLSANGRVQDRYHLPAGGGTIGRDAGEVRFPADRYVSGNHATVAIDKDKVTLLDMDSSNGTWVRLRRRTPLGAGDEIYVGSQVFRVTFPVA
jgi:pSer/pThr/pTyr-binding forkhead associated (FHA) protein